MDNELPYIDAAEFENKVTEYAKTNRVLKSVFNNPFSKIKKWQDLPPHLIQDLFKRLGCKPAIQKNLPIDNKLCKCGKVGQISCPNDERCGVDNTQLPAEVLNKISQDAEDLYNELDEKARQVDSYDFGLPMSKKIKKPITKLLIEYATKLHQAQQEIEGYVAEIESVGTLIKEHEPLQAKVERYKKALNDIAIGKLRAQQIAIDALAGEGDRICPNCKRVFNADRHGCCRECGSDDYHNQKEDQQ